MKIKNSQGKRFFGMHFYPGLAEYAEPGKNPFRVFLNEDTIRSMDSSFEGKPVFVQHVTEVEQNLDVLRGEADGWVVRSFYNAADGKHWAEFLVCSEKGLEAIAKGFRLSNAYRPVGPRGSSGLWNGIEYSEQILRGEYDHLAIVPNPRYEESVIMTPEQFKAYNEEQQFELKRITNSKDQPKGDNKMGLNFFKRAKIENSIDLESTVVQLPKSKKEFTITEAVMELDKFVNMAGYAADDHMVKMENGEEMSVKDMKDCMNKMRNAEKMEKEGMGKEDGEMKNEDAMDEELKTVDGRGGDEHLKNEDEDKEKKEKDEMKKNAVSKKVTSLKNAGPKMNSTEAQPRIFLSKDKLALGKSRYGSN